MPALKAVSHDQLLEYKLLVKLTSIVNKTIHFQIHTNYLLNLTHYNHLTINT